MLSDFDDDVDLADDGEAVTAAEVLQTLEEAWLNEKFSPDLLENKSEIVDCMLEQLHEMEENIRRAKKGDFKVSIHKMEIDRIRYVLCSYLRCRIEKIERFANHLLEEEVERTGEPRLTPEELQYAKEFKENTDNHFTALALRHMPPNQRTLDPKVTTVRPDLNSYVILRVHESAADVEIERETINDRHELSGGYTIDMEKGEVYIMRYECVKDLIAKGTVRLV